MGPRLDYIRSTGIVTVVWCQYAKRAKPIWQTISGNTYIATKLKCVKETISVSHTWLVCLFKPGWHGAMELISIKYKFSGANLTSVIRASKEEEEKRRKKLQRHDNFMEKKYIYF